jgi:aspartate/methionine/tyrosine aminotransferase
MNQSFVPFGLERMMSRWENVVEYNLSESGVHPLSMHELVNDSTLLDEILSIRLGYAQANGIGELRERIAALYPGATADNVLVTTGCAQANFTAALSMLHPGDELILMLPNYMQIWGIAQNFGFTLRTFSLKEELDWGIDLDVFEEMVSNRTKMIAVCNPNNPTGHIMTPEEMDSVVGAAAKIGAWLMADEVYAGAERVTDEFTPTFWGRYERVLAMGSMSKAYGLPGLRIGWAVAPQEIVETLWAWQDYITIGASMVANHLAAYALKPDVRSRLLARTRDYIRRGYGIFEQWWEEQGEVLSMIPPQAAAIAFVRYHVEVNSTELVDRLIQEKSVLVVPGDHFGLDHHLRVSYGLPEPYLREGLDRLKQLISSYR